MTIGAPIWLEVIHQHRAIPSDNANLRGVLPIDAATIAAAFGESDLVLMIGGPFFEEIWFSDGAPFPSGAAVLQIEASEQRLYNLAETGKYEGGFQSIKDSLTLAVASAAAAAVKPRCSTTLANTAISPKLSMCPHLWKQ